MAILISATSPINGEIDVPLNTEIVFRIIKDSGPIDLNSLNVVLDDGVLPEEPIINGVFSNDFDGEYIDTLGDLSDVTVVIIRPSDKPQYQSGREITVNIDVEISTILVYSFTPQTFQFTFPVTYSEELNLSSLPSGYTIQTSGTGSSPTFGSEGMTTIPNASGTSFIKKNAAGLDFEIGVLFDVVVSAGITTGKVDVLRISKEEQGIISVAVDFDNHEIWLNNIVNTLPFDFRPSIKGNTVFFRLSVKGTQDNLIARLYSGKEDYVDPYLMKQTGGPSITVPVTGDSIDIGSIIINNAPVIVKSFKVLLNENPDIYYPFPQISSIYPISDELSGGETFKMEFENNIDLDAGSELLFLDDVINNESIGSANMTVKSGVLTLFTTGIGSSIVRMLRSYSGDIPSGADVSVDFEVDSDIISNPLQDEVILAAMELRSNGVILAIEMVVDIINKAYFRVLLTNSGILVLNKKLMNTQKSNFTLRMIRAGNQVAVLVDGINIINTSLKDGPGIIRFYNKITLNRSISTEITNFTVRPIIMIGDSIVNT